MNGIFARCSETSFSRGSGSVTPLARTESSIRVTIASASSTRPCSASQRGDSGSSNRAAKPTVAITPPITNSSRQP